MKNKKGSVLIWVVIVLVLLGIGAYFLLSGGSDGGSVSSVGSSIPQPPALPQ